MIGLFFRLCRMFGEFCVCFLLLSPAVSMASGLSDTLTVPYVGNWVNSVSNVWEYGLYERFAIFDTDFWEYKKIDYGKRNVTVVLTKDGKEKVLHLQNPQAETLEIASGKGKAATYRWAKKGFTPYPDRDTTLFPTYRYGKDTVTVLGYYRHLERLPEKWRSKVVELGRNDYLTGEDVNVYADLDSCGRFRVKIPVAGLVRIYMDWSFLGKGAYVMPGEKLLVYADAADLLKRQYAATREEYWNYDSDVLFMGENARFHNEISHCPSALDIRGYYDFEKKELSDMQILKEIDGDYLNYLKAFDEYTERYPTLSRKCVSIIKEGALYQLANSLMQNRFRLLKKKRLTFESGYMEFVKSKFSLDREWYYLTEHYFQSFIRDYVDYHEMQKDLFLPDGTRYSLSPVQSLDILSYIKSNGLANAGETALIDDYFKVNKEVEELQMDTVAIRKLIEGNTDLFDRIHVYLNTETARGAKWLLEVRHEKAKLDSLLPNPYLRELQLGNYFMEELDRTRMPFPGKGMEWINENIQNPAIREQIGRVDGVYRKVASKEITWLESLKSSEHLKEYDDAKALFQKLIEPYKGSVVYLDIWGTWCQPCRMQMAYVKDVKAALKDKNVVYLYLANNSDESTWKNLIREYDLSGENVVHYRLPEKQQDMLERLLNVSGFPTFMLLDKEGNIANPNAPRPQEKEALVNEILKLLER